MALQTNNSARNFSAMNPCYFRKASGKLFRTIVNQHLVLSVKRTGTKEDKGSTMMLAMWLLWLAKRHILDEVMLSSEKIKPIALSIVELCLAEGIS